MAEFVVRAKARIEVPEPQARLPDGLAGYGVSDRE
jgi:hypothetical protein